VSRCFLPPYQLFAHSFASLLDQRARTFMFKEILSKYGSLALRVCRAIQREVVANSLVEFLILEGML